MKLDLRKDANAIARHIKQRVRDYPEYVNEGPGEDEDPVGEITLGYEWLSETAWVVLVFDTRPDATSDGEWTMHIEENVIELPRWAEAFHQLYETGTPVDITLKDGSRRRFTEYDEHEPSVLIGEMLRDVLLDARESGVFAKLPLAERCTMGVEHQNGAYGWPIYEKRHSEGSVA